MNQETIDQIENQLNSFDESDFFQSKFTPFSFADQQMQKSKKKEFFFCFYIIYSKISKVSLILFIKKTRNKRK